MANDSKYMTLAVDVGNTETKFGVFSHDRFCSSWSITTPCRITADEALLSLENFAAAKRIDLESVVDSVIASVVPSLTDSWIQALKQLCSRRPLVVGPGVKTGVSMRYSDPAEIGADRMADLVAAKAAYTPPLIIVDLGTTTNFEVVDAKGAFLGGLIAPGLRLSLQALSSAAARLPVVEVARPLSLIGKNTREAMQAGAVMGEVARIDGLIDMICAQLESPACVIVSGDDAAEISALLRHETQVDELLTLKGLHLIYKMNRKA